MLNTYSYSHFIGCETNYEKAKVVLVGAPFDGTTSYRPGARFAPGQIRLDSYGLETYSPYLDLDLEDFSIADIGDIDIPFGNTSKALLMIKDVIKELVQDSKKPLLIGGEHLVSLPIIEVLAQKHPDLHILHFDAHTDLREDYLGEKLSHATVMRRAFEVVGEHKIFQFGIRSGTKAEFEWAKKHTTLHKFDTSSLKDVVSTLKGKPIYLTVDLDILDPSIFSGTGTPEPGGITMTELLEALLILQDLNLVGADVVELSPHYDTSGASTATAAKIIREISLILSKR